MRKITGMIITMAAALGIGTCVSANVPERVEIKFSVGQDTLLINGTQTQVEKPYVVGEGVTLVPLRVITEAFGAEVEWVAQTKTINLSYPDVDISLQIDNPIAEVNGNAETLLSAPELTPNGFTMVPLRFISETFGAEVGYDAQTKAITVIKQTAENSGETVIDKVITQTKIGDSYYGWSMENPSQWEMTYRNFDGTFMVFEYDENNSFDIEIIPKNEDYDFDRTFIEIKNGLSGYTLIKADKDTEKIVKSMNFQAKNKEEFLSILSYEADEYVFYVYGYFDAKNSEIKDEGIRIINTFATKFKDTDTYDLSNVKDGMRNFEAENLKLSFNVPDNYFMVSPEESENKFYFASWEEDDLVSEINAEVYSKSAVTSAEELAKKDYYGNKEYMNPKMAKFTEVKAVKYNNFEGFEYTYKINGSLKNDAYHKDVFFEVGDYVYNIHVASKNTSLAEKDADKIINSVKAEALNAEDIGILMRNDVDYEGTFDVKTDKWSIKIPNSYQQITEGAYQSLRHGTLINVIVTEAGSDNLEDVLKDMKKEVEEIDKQTGVEVIVSPYKTKLRGEQLYATYTLLFEDSAEYYREVAIIIAKKKIVFQMVIPEKVYSDITKSELDGIISTYKNEY